MAKKDRQDQVSGRFDLSKGEAKSDRLTMAVQSSPTGTSPGKFKSS